MEHNLSSNEIKKILHPILEEIIGTKVKVDESLINSGLVDSMNLIDLTLALEEKFKISIHSTETIPENFESINLLTEFISKKI